MSESFYLYGGIAVMALITYVIRALPMVLFRKPIRSQWVRSFLYYVPYAVLSAMTFPAVLTSTNSIPLSAFGTIVAIVLAFSGKGLVTVACAAAAAVLLGEFFI